MERFADDRRLAFAGGQAQHFLRGTERRNREREAVQRDFGDGLEIAVAGLLPARRLVEAHDFDPAFVLEIGHRRIVERQMPVLAHAQDAEVDRMAAQQGFVMLALFERLGRIASEVVKFLRVNAFLDALVHVAGETRRMVRVDAEILVHVKQRHARPLDAAELHKGVEELELRIAGGQNRRRLAAFADAVLNLVLREPRRRGHQFGGTRINLNREPVHRKSLSWRSHGCFEQCSPALLRHRPGNGKP